MKKFKIELELTKQEIELIMLMGYGYVKKEDIDIILKNFDEGIKNQDYIKLNSEFEWDFRSILRIGFTTYAKLNNIDIDYPIEPYQARKFVIKNIDADFIDIHKL
jgi:hypothetical protein